MLFDNLNNRSQGFMGSTTLSALRVPNPFTCKLPVQQISGFMGSPHVGAPSSLPLLSRLCVHIPLMFVILSRFLSVSCKIVGTALF